VGESSGEARALIVHPSLELRGVAQVEAVEERTGVESNRFLERARVERAFEVADVHPDLDRVETNVVARGNDGCFAERAADDVDRIREPVPCAFGIELRPEKRNEAIATHRRP
jgi:hypothetical protein